MAGVSLRRNTLWSALGQVAGIILQAAYFILISRTLGSYDYGLFVGVYSMVAILSPYGSLGFGMIMLRDASRDRTHLPKGWGMSLSILARGSILVVAACVVIGHFLFDQKLLLIVVCVAFSDAFCVRAVELAGQAFQSCHLLAWTARLNALTALARTLAALLLAFYCWWRPGRASVLMWTLIYTGCSIVAASIALAMVHFRLVRPRFKKPTRQEMREGLSFALSTSSFSIYNDIDKTMLASYGFVQAAGTYAAAYRIIEVVTAPIRAVYAAAMPRIFQHGGESTGKVLRFSSYLLKWTGLYSVIACGLIFWGAPLLPLILGSSFRGSVGAVRLLAVLPLLRCFHYSAGNAISGCASQWYRTSAQLFAALLNLALNLALLPRWSWKGAAIASLITDGTLGIANWMTLLYLHGRRERQKATTPLAGPAHAL